MATFTSLHFTSLHTTNNPIFLYSYLLNIYVYTHSSQMHNRYFYFFSVNRNFLVNWNAFTPLHLINYVERFSCNHSCHFVHKSHYRLPLQVSVVRIFTIFLLLVFMDFFIPSLCFPTKIVFNLLSGPKTLLPENEEDKDKFIPQHSNVYFYFL